MYEKRDWLGILFFGAAILILLYMFISPLTNTIINIDEYWTYSLVNLPFMEGMTVAIHDVHPPLYYWILYLFTPFGLGNLYLLKVVSIIPYILIMVVSATKIREDYGWLTAGLFVFCLGVMTDFFMEFLTIRMYSWGLFFLLMVFIYYKDVITRWDKKSWVLLTLFTLLSVSTQYFLALTCGLVYLLILAEILTEHKDKIRQFAKSVLALIVLYAPWGIVFIHQIQTHANDAKEGFELVNVIHYFTAFAIKSQNFRLDMVIFKIIAIIFLIFILVLIYKKKDKFSAAGVFLMYATLAIGILSLMSSFTNSMRVRYLVPVFGIFWLSASIVIGKIKDYKVLAIALVLVLLLAGASLAITNEDINSRLTFNEKKASFLDGINNNDSVIVYNTDYGYKVLHNDLNNTSKQYTLSDSYFYSGDVEVCKDFDKILKENPDKNIYLVNWKLKESNKKFEDNYNLTKVYDADHYSFNLVKI
ncbi:hypothetical protein [Methanobrevibacter sp.]|uniref:hypothetical protein n=1 Tax=Methanobrevibacter sp. TaxID=66852 RepID=UPI003867D8A8